MKMNFLLKNNVTGEYECNGNFFSCISILEENKAILEAQGTWDHTVYTSGHQALPHFFSDVPYYAVRHKKGLILEPWSLKPGDARRRFSQHKHRYDPGYEDLLDLESWTMIDHQNVPVYEGRTRHWVTPDEPGQFALRFSHAGHTYLYLNSRNKAWCKNIHSLYCFASGRSFNRRSTTVIESTGQGKWQKRPEIDPWL